MLNLQEKVSRKIGNKLLQNCTYTHFITNVSEVMYRTGIPLPVQPKNKIMTCSMPDRLQNHIGIVLAKFGFTKCMKMTSSNKLAKTFLELC